jgi:hypothetical protein
MLFPSYPRPVRRHREVAEMTVRQARRAEIAPGHVLAVAERASEPVVLRLAGAERDGATDALRFDVRYRLGEYLAVVREWARLELERHELARSGRALPTLPPVSRALVTLIATPMFAWKKSRMPRCRFAIDDAGIVRRTRREALRASWSEVAAVRRCDTAMLIEFAWGALPLPHRCLDEAQRAAFDRLVARHVHADKVR